MNALSTTAEFEAGATVAATREQHLARITDLSLCLNNGDSLSAETEARNLIEGRPAYWHRGQFTAAGMLVFLSRCAEHNHSLLKACEAYVERHPNRDLVDALDGVIPLNQPAIDELQFCYRLQSTFRDDLADRERTAIFNPVFFPHMSQESRDRWQAQYEGAQRRWADRRDEEHEARKGMSLAAALAITAANVSLDDAARGAVEGEKMGEVA
jgi:hypothetical protein